MKHKHIWETMGPSTRCEICGDRKVKPEAPDRDAVNKYARELYRKKVSRA